MPASPLFWLWLAVLVWPVLWLSVLAHEAGHAVAGRLAGYHVGAWGLGAGEPFLLLPPASRCAHTRFFLCRRHPFSGLTGAVFPGLFPTRGQAATFLLGGVAANLLLTLIGAALAQVAAPAGITIMDVNGLLCVMALLPRSQSVPSDGARLLKLLSRRGTHLPAVTPQAALGQRALWQAVQAPFLTKFCALSAAFAAADLGDTETADFYLREADEQTEVSGPALDAYAALVRGLRDESAGNTDGARTHFARAQALYTAQGCDAAAHLARLFAAVSDVTVLNRLLADSLTRRFPALQSRAAGRALAAVCREATPEIGALETALSRFQNARLAWREDVQDAHLFALAAGALTRSGDNAGATALWEQAAGARARVELAIADAPALLAWYRARAVPSPS